MPLRYIRKRLTAENALSVAVATTAVTRELADMLQFPPARAAAGVLLLIFQTIQEIQSNRTECYRLARRCLTLLTDVRETMDGRWEDAPPSLLRNIAKFEETLQNMYEDLKAFAQNKWKNRLMKKNSIEAAITEYNVQLDDAARSFQITTLIHIHYAIGDGNTQNDDLPAVESLASVASSEEFCESPTSGGSQGSAFTDAELISFNDRSSTDDFVFVTEPSTEVTNTGILAALPAAVIADGVSAPKDWVNHALSRHDDHGFRRYHQSEVVNKGTSHIKKGWWTGAREVEVEGRQLVLLPYEGSDLTAAKRWMRDVRMLQNVYHPNLPQMVGYSGIDAPTPFILLANVQTRLPQAMVLDAIENASLLSCMKLLIRFYRDIFDSALYLQRQLGISESKLQDYIENATYRIDGQDTMIMGLPPPEVDRWNSFRNYGLTHSIRNVFIQILPNKGITRRPYDVEDNRSVELQRKLNHLSVLVKALLPSSDDCETASGRLKEISGGDEDEENEEGLTLPSLRMAAIKSNSHDYTWSPNFVPPYTYIIGDLGYIPPGKDFNSFVVLKNMIKDEITHLTVVQNTSGLFHKWGPGINRQPIHPFSVGSGFDGWPIMTLPGDKGYVHILYEYGFASISVSWQILLQHGRRIADEHGVKPEDLMLVTCAGLDMRFNVADMRHFMGSAMHQTQFQRPIFGFPPHFGGHQPHEMHAPQFGFQTPQPAVTYLFTSPEKGQQAAISETPVYIPGGGPSQIRDRRFTHNGTYGFMNYVQLHAEDFASECPANGGA